MEEELLDPMEHTIDELREQFEKYKLRNAERLHQERQLVVEFSLKEDLEKLREKMKNLRQGMDKLQNMQFNQMCWEHEDSIKTLPWSDREDGGQEAQYNEEEPEQTLFISCGLHSCIFENCGRQVDSQLLLMHYHSDHSEEGEADFHLCHKLREGQSTILSFTINRCELMQNQVVGMIAYAGSLIQFPTKHRQKLYNSFQPEELAYLETTVPVVVLICKTAVNAVLSRKLFTRCVLSTGTPEEEFFIIWLVTPHQQLQLNANLILCGRDAATRATSIIGVQKEKNSKKETCRFMPVDHNYWRLSYKDMSRITNNFRDELHLEVRLMQTKSKLF